MSSKQKSKIARKNGAKAAGSKTPQGIQNSAMNALRHGMTSKTLVLANESPEKFAQLLQMYIEKFQPQDGVEMNLVDEMVAARWRQQRGWAIQTALLDLQMENQECEVTSEPNRLAQAFTTMANQEKLLELLLRYETMYSRMHDRAMRALFRLREELNLRNDPKPDQSPDPPAPKTSKANPPACPPQQLKPIQPPTANSQTNATLHHTRVKPNERPNLET